MGETAQFRVILDTNQIISAGSNWLAGGVPVPRTAAQQLVYLIMNRHVGLYSSKIAAEYLEKLLDRNHPPHRIQEYLGCLLRLFEKVTIATTTCSPLPTDPDDAMFLLCAIDGRAHYLVTDDKHLLNVRKGYSAFTICRRDEVLTQLEQRVTERAPDVEHV